jgi:hypothetical protein
VDDVLTTGELRFMCLTALQEIAPDMALNPESMKLLLELYIKYDPDRAGTYLQDILKNVGPESEFRASAADRIAEEAGQTDCQIIIKRAHRRFADAVKQIGEELEQVLCDFLMGYSLQR